MAFDLCLQCRKVLGTLKHGQPLVSSTTVSLVHSPAPWWWCCFYHKLGDKPTRYTYRAAVLFRIWCSSFEASAWNTEILFSGHASVILPQLPSGTNRLLPAITFTVRIPNFRLGNLLVATETLTTSPRSTPALQRALNHVCLAVGGCTTKCSLSIACCSA